MVAAGVGGTTDAIRESLRRRASMRATIDVNAEAVAVSVGGLTTTRSAPLELPPGSAAASREAVRRPSECW